MLKFGDTVIVNGQTAIVIKVYPKIESYEPSPQVYEVALPTGEVVTMYEQAETDSLE